MNQSNLRNLILPALLVPCAVILIINLLSGGGNQLGNTFNFLMVIGAAIGFFSPRGGLVVFLIFQFYADFFKRLLVLGEGLSMQDVMASLGMGPIIVVAACVACTLQCVTGKVSFFNMRDIAIFLGCAVISVFGAFARESLDSSITALGQAALGSAMLGMTAYACYILFRTKKDAHMILKVMVIAAIPMALYSFKQQFLGIAGWEEAYIRTGLSQVLFDFYMMDGIDRMRPFSTLNTHTSLGAVSGALAVLCFFVLARGRTLFERRRSHLLAYGMLGVLYLATCIISRNRTTYALPLLAPVLIWLFSGGVRTFLFYVASVGLFTTVVKNSEWLDSQILIWAGQLDATTIGQKMGSIGTFQDRIKGFIALNDPNNWAPFGLPENARPFAHDQITEILTKLGYIPLFLALATVGFSLFWWHRHCLRIKDAADRKLLIALTATMVALGACSLAYGNLLFVAPVNSVLGFLLGLGLAVLHRQRETETEEAAAARSKRAEEASGRPAGSLSKSPA